jgi:hypothetical protein
LGEIVVQIVIISWLLTCQFSAIFPSDEVRWLTGRDLEKANLLAISAAWTDAPLRPRLLELSRRQRIAVFIDRRVDPTLVATFAVRNVTWEQLAWHIAERYGIGVCRIDDVYYFGPKEVCRSLPVHYQAFRRLISKSSKIHKVDWGRKSPVDWVRLSRPADLLTQIADANGLRIVGHERISFDVWDENELPDLSLLQQFVLLVAGFDSWIELGEDGSQVTIVPFANLETGSLTIGSVENAKQAAQEFSAKYPACKILAVGRSLNLSGKLSDIESIQRAVIDAQQPVIGDHLEHRFSLKANNKRISILRALAAQLGVELTYDPVVEHLLDDQIEFEIEAPLEVIIAKVLEGSGLTFQLTDQFLRIVRN